MKTKCIDLLFASLLVLSAPPADAQTIVPGPTISGTWTPSGNPYIVTSSCTIPAGTNLVIQPGVSVTLSANVRITNNGVIAALGTASSRISLQCTTSTQYWSGIWSFYAPGTNRFDYCDFRNTSTGVILTSKGSFVTMYAEIQNCTFSNCLFQGIYGEAIGGGGVPSGTAQIIPSIKNCLFDQTSQGIVLSLDGTPFSGGLYGYATATISDNIFRNLSMPALNLSVGTYPGTGAVSFVNNTLHNARTGVNTVDPWDAKIENCIFFASTNAVVRSGSLSGDVSYNCFWGGGTNFTGYPASYGQIVTQNRNGIPCDALFNIFQNPSFVGATDYHLTANSSCIDAGDGRAASDDRCFPPSQGTVLNDIGAYGGPDACGWNVPAPVSFSVSIALYVGVSFIPPSNGTYRIDYAPSMGNTNIWTSLTNVYLTSPYTYYDPAPFGQRYYRAVLLP